MFDVGRICMKLAGRDAGKICVIVDVLKEGYVLIDGQTRRRKCNIAHLEPLEKSVDLKKGASNADVIKALTALKIDCSEKKESKKVAKPRPKKIKAKKKAEPETATDKKTE